MGYDCHKHAKVWEVWGHTTPLLDALRLILRPIPDRSRPVVAVWLTEYYIQFLVVDVFAKPADFDFPREKVVRFAEQQVG